MKNGMKNVCDKHEFRTAVGVPVLCMSCDKIFKSPAQPPNLKDTMIDSEEQQQPVHNVCLLMDGGI